MFQQSQEAVCLIPAPSGFRIPVNCKQMFDKMCCSQELYHFDVVHALQRAPRISRVTPVHRHSAAWGEWIPSPKAPIELRCSWQVKLWASGFLEISFILQRDVCMTNGVQISQSCFRSGNDHDVLMQHPTRARVDSRLLMPAQDF